MIFDNLLRYAVRVVEAYSGEKPLHLWLKDFFRANPQMGSRDRKLVSEMTYCYYRLGHALPDTPAAERILVGLYLCNETPLPALEYLKPDWNREIDKRSADKIRLIKEAFPEFSIDQLFPYKQLLSEGLDPAAYNLSFLTKPDLFIRIRKGQDEKVMEKLFNSQVPFHSWSTGDQLLFKACSFANGTRLDDILALDRDAVIQDLSSQKTAAFMTIPGRDSDKIIRAWDCCAASGGKSILLADLHHTLDLTVSDIRKSILENLRVRFASAGIVRYQAFEKDLIREEDLPKQKFDLIIADLPCTGSGTWSRTPEALYFFDPAEIAQYGGRQKKILQQVVKCLRPGGYLVYITCSVFAAENEEVVRFIEKEEGLVLQEQRMITGYDAKADTLFAARFQRREAGTEVFEANREPC